MEQSSLFDKPERKAKPGGKKVDPAPLDDVIANEAEVRELAREYFELPDAEPPLLKAKREQAARANGAHLRGMVAKWAPYETAKGHVSIHDPGSGEWHDVVHKHAPGWAKWEARRRASLYKSGNRHAYDLTSAQMEEIWQQEHTAQEEGIVEDHPLEEDAV
jgi:hypothetical protein